MITMIISLAQTTDLDGIIHVHREGWLCTYPNPAAGVTYEAVERYVDAKENDRRAQWLRDLTNQNQTSHVWVAKEDNRVIGLCKATKDEQSGHIRALYVLPEMQGQGVGTALMKQAISWLGRSTDIALEVVVYNQRAIGFYEKLGFQRGQSVDPKTVSGRSNLNMPEIEMRLPAMRVWQKLSTKTILEHPRLTVVTDEILLSDHSTTNYLRFENVRDVVMVIAEQQGKIILQKEFTYPYNDFIYHLPGGDIKPDEEPDIAANRELSEEAGYRADSLELIGKFLVSNRRTTAWTYVYHATDLTETAKQPDPEEEIEVYWFTPREIDTMIKNGEIVNHYVLSSWNFYKVREQ